MDTNIGSDSNPGTLNAPWKKISRANNTLKAGDTVYIRAGSYEETIHPTNSGKPDNYITYTAFNGETVTIGGSITYGADLSDRTWIKIDGLQFTDTRKYWIQFWPNGSYNYIVNCDFEATKNTMSWAGLMIGYHADYNKIINNSFTSACYPADLLDIYSGSYNLVEGNYFGYSSHTALALQDKGLPVEYNIIRNNTFQNRFHNNLAIYKGPKNTLVEGNIILDAGDDCDAESCPKNICGSDRDRSADRDIHSGIQIAAENSIIRKNVLINNGVFSSGAWNNKITSVGNRIYNNTFYRNYYGLQFLANPEYAFSDNITKNNIFSESILYNLKFGAAITDDSNRFINNKFHGNSTVVFKYRRNVDDIQSQYTKEWIENSQLEQSGDEPGFINTSERIFTLESDSALVDAGAWMTAITSPSGSGDTFTVEDSRYFSDGFGVITGDKIQIQNQKSTIGIKSIDYNSNKIVVDRSISWKKGDGISLPYTGDGPDIGAFEYTSLKPPTLYIIQK